MSSLDNARKAAKRWLKALRAHDRDARERLRRVYPAAASDPTLRDVQHALARERGHAGWTELKASLDEATRPTAGASAHPDRVADFFEFACWDHHTHGRGDYAMNTRAAARLLEQHPEIARHSLSAAIVCGDVVEVNRVLAERPEAAQEPGGSRGWPPILYLCYGRVPVPPAGDNALVIARTLLDNGADPNAYYMAGDAKYSALVGVAGEGEQDAPPHPHREALFALLLERGAAPYDIQVLYNTHFHGDVLWWLELIYAHALKNGRLSEWQDPNWTMLDMGGYGPGAYFLFRIAVDHNDLRLAWWLLTHGASPNAYASSHPKFKPARTTLEEARRRGHTELADLLTRHGAVAKVLAPDEEDAVRVAFADACFKLDRDAAAAHLQRRPEYLASTEVMFEAARRDRVDVVRFLHDLGMSIDIEGRSGQRPLHVAAGNNALGVAAFLIEHGAEVDPRERQWNATPLSAACYSNVREMIRLLSPVSRDVWSLARTGNAERLRDVLASEPALARQVSRTGLTPLWWLPDDEEHAAQVVDLFLAHGADPAVEAREGSTAADHARKRGLEEAARRLGVFGQGPQAALDAGVEKYDALAKDLVVAYEMGDPAAMERLQRHYRRSIEWDELREGVRRRLSMAGRPERPADYFGLPQARMLVAREAGFDSWLALTKAVENDPALSAGMATQNAPDPGIIEPGMIRPVEMRGTLRVRLHEGDYTTTTDVWEMLTACRKGDLARVDELVSKCPALVRCDYNYMPPLHLAVREGHVELVRYLVERGAANPNYVTYPYKETLLTVASDRGHEEIGRILEEGYRAADSTRPPDEGGEIEYVKDEERVRFQKLVGSNALAEAGVLLARRPELALDELAFWGEGILSMPANRGNREMIELLLRHGARVPDVSKWGAWYYFKRYEIAAFLMERGMNANHMNWHHTTLLHDMAYTGDMRKAALLLDGGADIDAIDEEFQSTPLGLSARWGHLEMVKFLLERGADPNRAGAHWAAPLSWARIKKHAEVEAILREVT